MDQHTAARRNSKWLDGGKLRAARKEARLSQAQLGALVGVTQQTIGHFEAEDEGWNCDLEATCLLANAVEKPLGDLVHADGLEGVEGLSPALVPGPVSCQTPVCGSA